MQAVHWHTVFFMLFALAACGLAVAVTVSNNVVRMATYLVGSLAAVSGLFFLAGADFVGILQIMVYVGGTMILLAFGVMLTARAPGLDLRTGGGQWVVAVIAGGSLLAILLQTALYLSDDATIQTAAARGAPSAATEASGTSPSAASAGPSSGPLGMALLGARTDQIGASDPQPSGGRAGYLLPFEIVSVHLLVVLIGAAYLARPRRRPKSALPAAGRDAVTPPEAPFLEPLS